MKYLLSCYLLLTAYYLYADVPGNKPRPSYDVTITGLNQYKDYSFYRQDDDVALELKDSSSIHVPGGYGAPRCIDVWAVNKTTSVHTDTLYFCGGDEKKSKVIIIGIFQNHLTFSTATTKQKNKNTIPFSSVSNNQDDNKRFNKNHLIMYLISGLSFLILIALVFFVWKKNKEPKLQRSI